MSDGRALVEALIEKGNLDTVQAETIVQEYRRFLQLVANGPGPVVPSPLLDQVWHLHLTDTRAYAAFCDAAFGRFLHHTPGREAQSQDPAYTRTLEAYERTFGQPPHEQVWPSPATLRKQGWIGAPMLAGFALMFFGMVGLGDWAVLSGAVLFAGSLLWMLSISPWQFGTRGDGGCGGGCGCGGGD